MLNKLKKSLSLRLSSLRSTDSSSNPSTNRASDATMPDLMPSTSLLSSSVFRFSRSSSSSSRCSKKTCAICLGSMKPGQGRAIFTAECSHSFHFNCIASSVRHGNHLCPICRSHWKEIPYQAPAPTFSRSLSCQPYPRARVNPLDHARIALQLDHLPNPQPLPEPLHFNDDDPLEPRPPSDHPPLHHFRSATIAAFPEFQAIPASESRPEFATLVSLHAPPAHHHTRAPIDLAVVLDVSGSMAGTKLVLLKRAVRFVVQHLSPADRLAIVTFSSSALRVLRLQRMNHEGRDRAIVAVNSLSAGGGTNIAEGLRKGIRILQECHGRNPVSSIILLSDGKDTYNANNNCNGSNSKCVDYYTNLFPPSTHHGDSDNDGRSSNRRSGAIPVHTFGFGADHDAPAMHAISNSTGGTFSFIEAESAIQDAFARCIGGLLSVMAQEVQLSLTSASPVVTIGKIPAGNHSIKVSEQGRRATIHVGDLYADESKDFLVHVSVPAISSHNKQEEITPLFALACTYKDPLSQEVIHVDCETVKIRRPETLNSSDQILSMEVDRERNRLLVADAITEAKALAEKGDLDGAQLVLANQRSVLLASVSAQAGDALCCWLEAELRDVRERMVSQEMYETSGRAYVLSGLSSHSGQRATTRGESMVLMPIGYETPSMTNMVSRSQTLFSSPPEPVRALHRSGSLAQRRGL
ncbi:hypothetical protein MRB53_024606 [Persea americana]|uniref:Uncharacterized protein n=1 Tax=Persea americana TaxID=3435 RepID=A0ACC2LD83_PERAE|nr:hypothetical protein MRB53_024606 [Persea americana]